MSKLFYRSFVLLTTALLAVSGFFVSTGIASAATSLFSDGFETDLSQWYRSSTSDTGQSDTNTPGDYYAWIEDDANITASINTTGYGNIQFSYDRRTFSVGSGDRLRVQWRIGNSGSFTELEAVNSDTWEVKTWTLTGAENKSEIQIRFFLDNGEGDYGWVDDVLVTGTDAVPPVIAAHAPVVEVANSLGGATVNYTLPTATDNVDPVVTVTCAPTSGIFTIAGSPHTITCNATDTAGNPAIPTTFTITVTPGPVDANHSTLDVSANSAIAGTPIIVIITAKDQYDNPIPGIPAANVSISASPLTGVTYVQPSTATDANGQTTAQFTSSVSGLKTVSAIVSSILLTQTQPVTFTIGNPALAVITARPSATVEANSSGTSVNLDILITDGNHNPVADGIAITVSSSLGDVTGSETTLSGHISRVLTYNNKGDANLTVTPPLGVIPASGASGDTTIHFVDTTDPLVTLNGDNPITWEFRQTPYTDPGATAVDNIDGVIPATCDASGVHPDVINQTPPYTDKIVAIYTVPCTATDNSGNSQTVNRTVNVVDTTAPVIVSITSDATSTGALKIGDAIHFTLTAEGTEPDGTVVNNSTYNGQTLVWSTSDHHIWTTTYTITEGDADQTSPLQITGVTMTDEAGNISDPASGTDVQKTIDAHRPVVSSVDSDGQTYNLVTVSPHTIKVTFNEDISNLPSVDIHSVPVDPQTVNDCDDGDAKTFCFDYTIVVPQELPHTIYISDAQDMAGNTMVTDSTHTFVVDTLAPVLAETTPVTDPTNDATPDYTFTSGEAGAITYGGSCSSGQTSAINGDNTITFNHLADGTYSDCTITVTDGAGNPSSLLTVSAFTVDTVHPTVTLDSTAPNPTNTKPIPVTVHFSQPVSDFDETDVVVTNGTVDTGSFAGSGTDYSFNVTPNGSNPEVITVSVDIAADVAHDAAGNGNIAATTLSRVYDTTPPTVIGLSNDDNPVKSKTWNWDADETSTFRYLIDTNPTWPSPTGDFDATITATQPDGTGTYYIHVQAKDVAGNIGDVASVYATLDNTAPVIDQHDPIVLTADSNGGRVVDYTVTASDNHDSSVVVNCFPASGYKFPVSETTPVICNATDQAGNAANPMTFDVTINPDVIISFTLTAYPDNLAFNQTSLITVTGYDQFGNETNVNSTSFILSADGGGSLDNTILTLNDEGVATANLSKDSAGIVHVTASSDGLTPQSVTVTFKEVDDVGPHVVSHTPANGAPNVAVNVHPVLVFDEPLDTTTVSSANIQLRKYSDDSVVPASVSPAEGDRHAVITPASPLDFSTQYYFAVSADVTDKVGNHLSPVLDNTTKYDHKFTTVADTTILAVTGISAIKTYATADGTYENGWSWIFNVTVPTTETELQMKFADWTSALLTTIPAANNIRYSSAQASNGPIEVELNDYGDALNLTGDLDSGSAGRQVEILVEARIPEGSAGGSYSTSYGIKSSTP